jgi:hypothetical protein
MFCGTRLPANYDLQRQSQSGIVDPGDYLYIRIKYIIIYHENKENISIEHIRAQHKVLNADFDKTNTDLSRVPTSGDYNFAKVIGKGKIQFVPLLVDQITDKSDYIERIYTSKPVFSDINEVEQFLQTTNYKKEIEVLSIYICPMVDGLLGQANLFSNSCMINWRTVGSSMFSGDPLLVNYNHGRTATHQIGHILGLPHIFSENGTCDISEFHDIPAQRYPNIDAYIICQNGVYTATLCNHFRDCNQPYYNRVEENVPYSCSNDHQHKYEMFMNFMDYGDDNNSIIFSKTQVQAMRNYLLSCTILTIQPIQSNEEHIHSPVS